MHQTDLALQHALDRQAALRRPADRHQVPGPSGRRGGLRRRVGASIVWFGRRVAGARSSRPAWQA